METFTFYSLLEAPRSRLVDSLLSQTDPNWTLTFLVNPGQEPSAASLQNQYPDPRIVYERVETPVRKILLELDPSRIESWFAVLKQDTQLEPDAIATYRAAIQPDTKVVYGDEAYMNRWGLVSGFQPVGQLNPLRLAFQDYLTGLVLIHRECLQDTPLLGMAGECPRHYLMLRTLRVFGPKAFTYIPQVKAHSFRNHIKSRPPFIPPFDDWTAINHSPLPDLQLSVTDKGWPEFTPLVQKHPLVQILYVVSDREDTNRQFATDINLNQWNYLNLEVVLLARPNQAHLAKQLAFKLVRDPDRIIVASNGMPQALNMAMQESEAEFSFLLEGEPLPSSLHYLVASLPWKYTVATGQAICSSRLVKPGAPPWDLEGNQWTTAGFFGEQLVPRNTSFASTACALFDRRAVIEAGGFREEYPTLYLADLCLRLPKYRVVHVPMAQVWIGRPTEPSEDEIQKFQANWDGWKDPFNEHQLNQ